MDFDAVLPPPGEEAHALSHAGEEMLLYQELDQLTNDHQKRSDLRDRSQCIHDEVHSWLEQYDALSEALQAYLHDHLQPPIYDSSELDTFSIEVVDIFAHRVRTFKHQSPHINVTLMHHGCIGCSVIRPSIAITIRTLAVYLQTHHVCPRLSIHAEAKSYVYYHRYLATQYRIAYDVYLEVLRRIDMKIDTHLGHDTPHWCMLNSCPACQYTLEDEPALKFSVLCACDGNNSTKLVDSVICRGNERLDPRSGLSSIWLTEEYVDGFKDEVQSARTRQAKDIQVDQQQIQDPDDPWVNEPDSTDAEPSNVCIDRWRNAAPESHKKMFAIFKKSSIFITICDMV
ncbi:hypothetical protein P692DRAFT_20849792 [Suillus brevipes Sb2]|nr:hypothetical protein P692DRAFT_20849792 [Suillus brevipes Sb2]